MKAKPRMNIDPILAAKSQAMSLEHARKHTKKVFAKLDREAFKEDQIEMFNDNSNP